MTRKAAETVRRPCTILLCAFVALLGAGSVVPALAAAAEAKLEVNENCVEPDWPCWATPGSSQPASKVTIAGGGSITFADAGTAANIAWTGTAPTCEPGVPVAPTAPATGWEGKCTFTTPGTYKFESTTLFNDGVDNYTKYEVLVGGTPKARTTPAGAGHQTEAVLAGTIEPEGTSTEYHFDYGTASLAEHMTAPTSLGAVDFSSHPVSLPVTGLLPGTEYHFELIVTYGAGQTAAGGSQSFTTTVATEPTASTQAATAVEETEATLNGTVDPEGGAGAEYFFEWGAGSGVSYEHMTAAVSLPSDGAEHRVSTVVSGLTPGGGYHFRLVAKNGLGSVPGDDLTFTAASPPPAKEPPAGQPAPNQPAPTPASTGASPATPTAGTPPSAQPKTVVKLTTVKGRSLLATTGGRTLYSLSVERHGKFACTKASGCLKIWHPLTVASGVTPKGPVALGTVRRPEGQLQVTYKGLPLYTFTGDKKPGQANGEGLKEGGTWHAAAAPGRH